MNKNNQRKSKQLLLFIGRGLLFICLVFNLLHLPSANAQVVENNKYGFSLILPDEWKVVYGRGEMQGTLLFSAFDKENAGKILVSAMPPYPVAMYSTEYSEILDIFINRFSAKRPDVKVESIKKDTIANQDANIAVYSWPRKDGGRQIVINAAFWMNDTILDIVGVFKETQREQGLQMFSEILNSLKLNESTSRDWLISGIPIKKTAITQKPAKPLQVPPDFIPKTLITIMNWPIAMLKLKIIYKQSTPYQKP